DLVSKLALHPHPEGGWYREIYRSPTRVETARGPRSALTTIYYLLEQGQLSRWHVVQADELWHFYAGEPLELLEYDPVTGRFARHVLGPVGGGGGPAGARGDVGSTGLGGAPRMSAVGSTTPDGVGPFGTAAAVGSSGVGGPVAVCGGAELRSPTSVAVIPT